MLSSREICVTYANGVVALEPTSLSFERGSFVVLLGSSGAGKSTLLRALNGLVRPRSGDVLGSDGKSIFASAAALRSHRRRTAMVFQQHHLIGRLSILKNVLMGRLAHHSSLRSLLPLPKADRMVALEALDRVGLAARALERADQISGGQQQRVGIARAMAQKPDIILADEPVASLDPATAFQVLTDLHRICREDGITTVVSLHQVDLARQFADRICALVQGRVVFDGAPSALSDIKLDAIYGASNSSPISSFALAAE
ncbi:phosphonate ABC transporter ATP-binding protein [Rhodopseudomonas palustris]|uniref:phosphonate ABC transporter ATP-binding protein n=1 Tax=Rhodopseudomonas palustris TaxID=1076 RepID=UPI002ACD8B83|nr:phosphonate ABC transporter ATP-binding protein [Rhodopseudomonas palustris]WQH01328.1 phosphonate ABC transporter ATP-binding protein [Rhodopseudomonas palustris]